VRNQQGLSPAAPAQFFLSLSPCEYCFSHWVTILTLLRPASNCYPDWRGYVVSGFSLVWIANFYMSISVPAPGDSRGAPRDRESRGRAAEKSGRPGRMVESLARAAAGQGLTLIVFASTTRRPAAADTSTVMPIATPTTGRRHSAAVRPCRRWS